MAHPRSSGAAHWREFFGARRYRERPAPAYRPSCCRSPLWDEMVREFGPARAEQMLAEFRMEQRWLVCSLLYGSGLRLCEALELRVKDGERQDGHSAGWRWPAGRSDNTWVSFFPIGNELLPHLAEGRRVWMEAVGLEEFRLVHGRLPEINAAVAGVVSFDAELGPAPVDARGAGPVS